MNVKPLSSGDLRDKLKKYGMDVNVILYQDIKRHNKLSEIMPCILLYQLDSPSFGHWTCLFRNNEGINYFDSTGHIPDELLKTHFNGALMSREYVNEDYTYLSKLMSDTGEPIIYNEIKLQPNNTMTCGYWCFNRMYLNNIFQDEYAKLWKQYKDGERERKIVAFYNYLN